MFKQRNFQIFWMTPPLPLTSELYELHCKLQQQTDPSIPEDPYSLTCSSTGKLVSAHRKQKRRRQFLTFPGVLGMLGVVRDDSFMRQGIHAPLCGCK